MARTPVSRVAALCALAVAVGCTWESRVPRGQPITLPETAASEIRMLSFCEPVVARLDCQGSRECNHWYRLDVREAGELRIVLALREIATARPGTDEGALTRLILRPMGKPILDQQMSTRGESLEIRASVEPDVYAVLVQGAGLPRSYELTASRGAAAEACAKPADGPAVSDER
jgi:hypothetical protein